jgi:hypothetical protein
VKCGVQGSILTDIEPVANETGFGLSPEAPGDRVCIADSFKPEAINCQELFEWL